MENLLGGQAGHNRSDYVPPKGYPFPIQLSCEDPAATADPYRVTHLRSLPRRPRARNDRPRSRPLHHRSRCCSRIMVPASASQHFFPGRSTAQRRRVPRNPDVYPRTPDTPPTAIENIVGWLCCCARRGKSRSPPTVVNKVVGGSIAFPRFCLG